jgi:hypothetical protein
MTTIIKYYAILANEGSNILDLWDEMKQKIRL